MIAEITQIQRGDTLTAPNGTPSLVADIRGRRVMLEDADGSRFIANLTHLSHWMHTSTRNGEHQAIKTSGFAAAIEAAPRRQLERVAHGLGGWTVGKLRRHAAGGWTPPPMARAHVAAALGRDMGELFADRETV